MKKIYSFIMVSIIALTANAQLVINENFTGYTNGNLGTQGGWVQKGTGTDVQVSTTTPLTYTGYTSGTKYVTVGATDGKDPWKPFSSPISTGSDKTIYMSFVVRVTSSAEENKAVYSLALRDTTSSNLNNIPCKFYIAEQQGAGTNIEFGIAVGTSSPVYTNAVFSYGTTYLIVIRYDIVSGANNDKAYLWVNPSLSAEPSIAIATGNTGATQTGTGEAGYGSTLQALQIFQSSTDSPVSAFDAFRVSQGSPSAAAWSNLSPAGSSLPVILTSFNADNDGLSTKLIWNVAEEEAFANYVIEKSTDGRTFTAIGTVKATSQKTYSFTDGSTSDNNSFYRLKMVDINGDFKYSYIVSIKSKLIANISLSPNPVKNNLMIQHPKVITEGHIQVISANGQLLKDVKLAANAVISNVDMSGFTSGLYHILFKSGSDMFNKTVIKQ
ncbi:MAG: T9SS type A sorting domain-containing protein [Niastella sp.]|jgi:hypothetical protein|uniref:T9SS type A sorting domain-containing protein n=1 Tax=Niastella sp. TaxID=1869183 RepID=UPI00389A3C39